MRDARVNPRSLDALVTHQIRRWELDEQRRLRKLTPPCIAFSRLPASGAHEIAHGVAEVLGFGFFGIEIVDRMARERGIQRDLVAGLDERVRNTIERYVLSALWGARFTEEDYLRGVVRTIATLGERGMAVILGRGSPFVLEPERALRVLVVAPREHRLERLCKQENLPHERAVETLARLDEERKLFLRHHFRVEPDDPSLYDLVVNSAIFDHEGSVSLIADSYRRRFPGCP